MPMDSVCEPVDFNAHGVHIATATATTMKTVSFPNGAIKKHKHRPPLAADHHHSHPYRECLRNHAASLGGHALDGCGEFLPSPSADPAVPSSLLCDACGCHRNFHRRVPDSPSHRHQATNGRRRTRQDVEAHPGHVNGRSCSDEDQELGDEEEDDDDDVDEGEDGRHRISPSPPPPPSLYSSAPHMLMALSSGVPPGSHGPVRHAAPLASAGAPAAQPKKRSRSKFSPEQKERMQELSERLGWRMSKKDEGMVEECCRGIGVDKGVFKVWMHNNKHHFVLSRRADAASGSSGGGMDGIANGNGHAVLNGSSSSS